MRIGATHLSALPHPAIVVNAHPRVLSWTHGDYLLGGGVRAGSLCLRIENVYAWLQRLAELAVSSALEFNYGVPVLGQYPDGGLIGTVVSHAWSCHRADRTEADLPFDAALTAITLITHVMPPGRRPLPCGNCRGLACCILGPGRSGAGHLPGAGASSESADSRQEQPRQQRPAGASYHCTLPLPFPAAPAAAALLPFDGVVRPGESGGCHVCEPLLSLPVFSASE
jgi:hypothetical protein